MDKNTLIGKRVMHIQTRAIGTIIEIFGNEIMISYHGQESKYAFPDAFASILEIEDESIQEELVKTGSTADFNDFKRLYAKSINNEINFLKDTGGKKYKVIDGERLHSQNEEYIYAFDTDAELHFPDGTPIRLRTIDNILTAYVISCEEYTIMIRSKEYIGDKVKSIEFTVEQWMLLEALTDRLTEMNPDTNSIAYEVACKGKFKVNNRKRIACGQEYAINRAISEPVTFIWGPPGTGKTQTLAKIALECIFQGKRVLMLSYSNVSVDGALLRVANMADCPPGQIIRYGYPRVTELIESKTLTSYQFVLSEYPDIAEEYQALISTKRKLKVKDPRRIELNKRLNKIRELLLEKEKALIQNAAFVATTVSKAVVDKAINLQKFDVVIFDEASMAYVPQIVFASGLAKSSFICLGDFCQLPAIVQNNQEQRLSNDIFAYAGIQNAVNNGNSHEWLVMLNVQYRMHQEIADFVGHEMYRDMLQTSNTIYDSRAKVASCEPMENEAMCMVDLSYMYSVCKKTMDGSRINLLSALVCVRLAESLADKYEIGIITPYNAQSRLILSMIRDLKEKDNRFSKITCATVHQFQGSEKPVIVYDAVDCFRMPYPGALLTSLKNDTANRLFNVALTRTQGKFILVTNRDFLLRKNISKKLMFTKALNLMSRNEAYLDGNDAIDTLKNEKQKNTVVLFGDKVDTWGKYIADIQAANEEVNIDIPGLIDDNEEALADLASTLVELKTKNVKIKIRLDESIVLPSALQSFTISSPYVTTPVTVVDKSIIWFGQPLAAADFITEGTFLETEYFPCVRFEGTHAAKAVQAFWDL